MAILRRSRSWRPRAAVRGRRCGAPRSRRYCPAPPRPADPSSATFSDVFFPLHARARAKPSNSADKGSGPSLLITGCAASAPAATMSMNPNRRGSLNVTTALDDIWNTTWSCATLGVPSPRSTRKEPDIPRCIRSVSSDDSGRTRYLARRVTSSTVWPMSRSRNRFGKGVRRFRRRTITSAKRASSITGAIRRRTDSTSGSSGMVTQQRTPFASNPRNPGGI